MKFPIRIRISENQEKVYVVHLAANGALRSLVYDSFRDSKNTWGYDWESHFNSQKYMEFDSLLEEAQRNNDLWESDSFDELENHPKYSNRFEKIEDKYNAEKNVTEYGHPYLIRYFYPDSQKEFDKINLRQLLREALIQYTNNVEIR